MLRLPQVQQRGDTAALTILGQAKRVLPRGQRAFGDIELIIQLPQGEVRGGHVADQRGHYRFPVLLGAEQIRARRFGGSAEPSPDVDLE